MILPLSGAEPVKVAMGSLPPSTCILLVGSGKLLIGHTDGSVSLWSTQTAQRLRVYPSYSPPGSSAAAPGSPGMSKFDALVHRSVRRLFALSETFFAACFGQQEAVLWPLLDSPGEDDEEDELMPAAHIALKEPFLNIAHFEQAVHFLSATSLSIWELDQRALDGLLSQTAPPLSPPPASPKGRHHVDEAKTDSDKDNSPVKRKGSSFFLFKRSGGGSPAKEKGGKEKKPPSPRSSSSFGSTESDQSPLEDSEEAADQSGPFCHILPP